jgi:hypothetical protein
LGRSGEAGESTAEQVLVETPAERSTSHWFEGAIDLAPLNLAAPTGLVLHFEATDNDDVSGPNMGRSSEVVLRVVSDSELRADLLRREQEVRQQFAALVKAQDELVTESRVLAASANNGNWPLEHVEQVIAAQKQQTQIGERTGALAQRLESMALEIFNNRLEEPDGPLAKRLTGAIVAPMRQLAEQEIPAAAENLAQARLAEPSHQRKSLLDETVGLQERIKSQMDDILNQLVQAEGYQEAINLLYEIEKAQGGVHEQTLKAREERIRRILEGNNRP